MASGQSMRTDNEQSKYKYKYIINKTTIIIIIYMKNSSRAKSALSIRSNVSFNPFNPYDAYLKVKGSNDINLSIPTAHSRIGSGTIKNR